MSRWAFALSLVLVSVSLGAQGQSVPPTVTGAAGIRLFSANLEKSRDFYAKQLGLRECHSGAALCFQINPIQAIELDYLGRDTRQDRLSLVAFEAKDVGTLRQYMRAQGIQSGEPITRADGTKAFDVLDPEGHSVEFVEHHTSVLPTRTEHDVQVSNHLIHLGYVVQNRTAMDHFYRDILGFHVYWHGGMKDDETNWVDMQVSDPHGTDWIEYMLGISPNASHKTLGVMNHTALGVPDIHKAQEQLIKNGWKGEEPKIGRDGKWQLNLYDPDETRVELMEFTPTKDPCCSPYTGPHPHQ